VVERLSDTARPIAAGAFLTGLLAALSGVGQFATSIYLPSMSAIAADLATSISLVQLTLTAYLVAFALVQLVYGPLSDRFGRRRVVIAGLVVFLAGTLICAVATHIATLLVGRFVQAVGAGAGIVIARAVVRDLFDGAAMMRVMGMITIVFALVPGLTPLLGGVAQDTLGWRFVFWVTIAAATLLLALVVFRLPETRRPSATAQPMFDYAPILASPVFRRYALSSAFVQGGLFAFFAGSPAVFIDTIAVSPTEYGFYPPLAVSGFIIGGIVVRRIADRLEASQIAATGLGLIVVGAALMLVLPLVTGAGRWQINIPIIVFVSGMGVFMPTAVSMALAGFPGRAGAASALIGFLQMSVAAAAAASVSALHVALGDLAFPAVMALLSVAAVATFALAGPVAERATVRDPA
jgi:DHA1 family bicyclomycin/chloramphenicol resistance-like MFS transporter